MSPLSLLTLAILPFTIAQQIGNVRDPLPELLTQTCTTDGGCTTQKTHIVLDSLSHPLVDIKTGKPCINPKTDSLDKKICSTAKECAQRCQFKAINYHNNGVVTDGEDLHMHMYLQVGDQLKTMSPRAYLLNDDLEEYTMLKLLGKELTFDVDMSKLPCGMNSALYLSEMSSTGGRSKLNPAGATFGTGYCDAQCYNTSAFINGVANVDTLGACCNEMDIWESNARATSYTPHTCTKPGLYECSGSECDADGICDKSGCGFNPYALGAQQYYGLDKTVNTRKPMTVTTQFITDDGTPEGTLVEIRRLYVQNGKVINNAVVDFQKSELDSLTRPYCKNEAKDFTKRGGLSTMGEALGRGMVLIFALWNDAGAFMNWLDAGDAGPCNMKEGNPELIKENSPWTSVTFSGIKWGDLNSTYSAS